MPRFLISGDNILTTKYDQDKIKTVKPLRFGLEVHFTNGRVITIDGKTIDLNYNQLAIELNRDLKNKKSTGIHTYINYSGKAQVIITNDRYD